MLRNGAASASKRWADKAIAKRNGSGGCMAGSLQGNSVLLDVFIDPRSGRADVVELLSVLDAILPAELAVAGEHELLDIGALGGNVVVAEQRQSEIAGRQFLTQARAVATARSLGAI